MLGRKKKKKTGTQIAMQIGETISTSARRIYKPDLSVKVLGIACIVIFSSAIIFGLWGIVSRNFDILERQKRIENLELEFKTLAKDIEIKKELKEKLIKDSLTIEAFARSYGMSKKGEKVFYFLD